jgi:hypothetical protein
MSTLTTLAIERQRSRRERAERLAALKREALSAALEWIEPMRNAHTGASSIALAVVRGDLDEDHVRQRWPNL